MAQYDVHPGKTGLGYLLDIQHDMLDHLPTRVVIPLMPVDLGDALGRLNPTFDIGGEAHMLAVQFMFTIAATELGKPTTSLAAHHWPITGALDMLVSGI